MVTTIIQEHIANAGYGAQTRLAEALDVKVQTVNKWVKGQTKPESWRWPEIERFFGLNEGHIARSAGHPVLASDDELLAAINRLEAELEMLKAQVVKRSEGTAADQQRSQRAD